MAQKGQAETRQVFIWKHFWFFSWHFMFWSMGRWILAHWKSVRPILQMPGPEARKHHDLFCAIVTRDNKERSLTDRLIQPTRYRLSPEAARELCLYYGTFVDVAPWQYGTAHRCRAKKRTRNVFLISLAAFTTTCYLYIPGSPFFAWTTLLLFFLALGSLSGWYASACLHDLAVGAEKLREEDMKHK